MNAIPIEHGIYYLDAHYVQAGVAAVYLLVEDKKVCIIETGTSLSAPRVMQAIESLGLGAPDVAYVIPTHIHLDHAGGAGALIRDCPNAQLVIHPRGAEHMIHPEKLIAGTRQVYGSRFESLYGDIVPVPAARVLIAEDGFELQIKDRKLLFIDTPGHALHHFCVIDETSSGIFSGDTLGIAYPQLSTPQGRFIFATTTPTQFDPDALLNSLDRILEYSLNTAYLTHFGPIALYPELAHQYRRSIIDQAQLALGMQGDPEDRLQRLQAALSTLFLDTILSMGGSQAPEYYQQQLESDTRLNAQGLEVWLKRLEKNPA